MSILLLGAVTNIYLGPGNAGCFIHEKHHNATVQDLLDGGVKQERRFKMEPI
jgi:hypothetical protein